MRVALTALSVSALLFAGCASPDPPRAQLPDPRGVEPPSWESPPQDPGAATVGVRVVAAEGPHGRATPLPVPARFYSFNLFGERDWYPEANETFVAMLKALRPGYLRWPSGHPGQHYVFDAAGTVKPAKGMWVLTPAHLDAFIALTRAVDAEPLFEVNIKSGTPENAAALVAFANRERGYGIKWWQLGNEPDLKQDEHQGPEHVTRVSAIFANAMLAVDPAIRFVGPELMMGADVVGAHGRENWMRPFAEANGAWIGALSWHWYPLDSEQPDPRSSAYPSFEHFLQYTAPDWRASGISFADEAMREVRTLRDAHAPQAEIWITEMGPDSGAPGAPGLTDTHAAALWWADVLGRLMAADADAVFQFAFHHWTPSRLSLLDADLDPIPPYLTWHLLSNAYRGNAVRAESTDDANVSAFAVTRPDGSLAVLMVNKRAENVTAQLDLPGFRGMGPATYYRIEAEGPLALESRINGVAITKEAVAGGTLQIPPRTAPAGPTTQWVLPGYTVTLVEFQAAR